MGKYRKRPIVVEAVQFKASDPTTHLHVNFGSPDDKSDLANKYWIQTLEGLLIVSENDWIITGIEGEHYPCKPIIFEATYEPA